jgi:hypothetical protein
MTFTDQASYDNVGFDPVITAVACRRLTIRELATSGTPGAYSVAAPLSSNAVFPKYPAESTTFEAAPGTMFDAGVTVGYIQASAGTIVFSRIHE